MPFKNRKQQAKCYALKAKGKNGTWNCDEWSHAQAGGSFGMLSAIELAKLQKETVSNNLQRLNRHAMDESDVYYEKNSFDYKPEDFNNAINLTQGRYNTGKIPKVMIDRAVKAANDNKIDLYDLLALMGQESTFGYKSREEGIPEKNVVSGWNLGVYPKSQDLFLADRKVPYMKIHNKGSMLEAYPDDYNKVQEVEKYVNSHPELLDQYQDVLNKDDYSNNGNYLDLAAKFIKKKGFKPYNPGDPDYSNKIAKSKALLLKEKELTNYINSTTKKKTVGKYQFGGGEEEQQQDDNFFNTLLQAAAQNQSQQDEYLDPSLFEDNTDEEPNADYSDLQAQIEELKTQIASQSQMANQSNDEFLNLLFENDSSNEPIIFEDSLEPSDTPSTMPSAFRGIFRNEGARTGQLTSLNSSALGRGQMVKGTRMMMYKKLGISNIDAAEEAFKTNPDFEGTVLNAYREDLDQSINPSIQGKQREYMIAKGWYTGDPNYPDERVPHPEAGNKITAGEYARRATKQAGGIANTPEELHNGLNNMDLGSMILNLPNTYNTIRGLDSGEPVLVMDEKGTQKILRGNKQTTRLKGKVYEIKI